MNLGSKNENEGTIVWVLLAASVDIADGESVFIIDDNVGRLPTNSGSARGEPQVKAC
jgi:hypothetical protein